jgi:hypothetical protein
MFDRLQWPRVIEAGVQMHKHLPNYGTKSRSGT